MRIIAFSISLIFHLLLLNLYWEKHNQVNEIAVKDLPLRIQVRLQKQMVQIAHEFIFNKFGTLFLECVLI